MKTVGAFEHNFYRKALNTQWTRKVKNADTLLDLNIGGNYLMTSIMTGEVSLPVSGVIVVWKQTGNRLRRLGWPGYRDDYER